jgi:hypothetical protein
MKIKNYIIVDIHEMLCLLASKRLAERENEKRVATLLRRHFVKPRKAITDDHNAYVVANPAPPEWDGQDIPQALIEQRTAHYNDLMEEEQDVGEIPAHLYLTEKDLPKIMKGELGDQNRVGTAMIIARLHFLYKLEGDDEEVADGNDGADAVVEAN